MFQKHNLYTTACRMKTVPSVYNLLIDTIYLSHTTQVCSSAAGGTVFKNHTVFILALCGVRDDY